MATITNLTIKGQVTIPKSVRDALGLRANEPVEIAYDGGEVATIRKAHREPPDEEIAFQTELARLEELAERWSHLRTGTDPDLLMSDLRERFPMPDAADL